MSMMKFVFLIFLSLSGFRQADHKADGPSKERRANIVFLISEDPDNYEAHRTVPVFAETLEREHGFKVTVIKGTGPREAFRFPGLEALAHADLLVVFCRRVALAPQQLDIIQDYLRAGGPLVGIRTANHAFSVREQPEQGHEAWWDFVPEVLGCENRGYGPVEPGTRVSVASGSHEHEILEGVSPLEWHSAGNLYLVAPLLDKNAKVLLNGAADNRVEPIAWTRLSGNKGRVFYTSLGYPDDFKTEQFQKLLVNGIKWALK